MRRILQIAGRNGAIIVISGVVLGLLLPSASNLARPYLAIAIFIFTFGSFLKFDARSIGSEITETRRNLLMVLWATFGVPLVIAVGAAVFHPGPDLAQGLLFWSLVPVSPACVAFASILRLNATVALLASIFGIAAAPFYIPLLATMLGGYHVSIDPYATSFELVVIVGGAFALSIVAKKVFGGFIKANPEAMTGIAVIALFLAGLGSMKGMQAHFVMQPLVSLEYVALAYVLLFGFEIAGTLLFWRYGREAAFTAGLISGTRTITLAWVVLGSNVTPMADLFLASSMIAKYTAPGLTKWLLAGLFAPVPHQAPAIKAAA